MCFFCYEKTVISSEFTNDRIKLNSRAYQKLVTWKLSTIALASWIIMAFITNRNNPSVNIVIGIDRISNTGFTRKFNSPSTMATIMAVPKPFTCTPGNSIDVTYTANAEIRMFTIVPIVMLFMNLYYGANLHIILYLFNVCRVN